MFSFFHAAVLAGLAGLALPVLIHLLAKPRPKRIPFSSIAFLKVIQNQKARSFRLRQILLLMLRTAAVACLVLGFARPVMRSASSRRSEGGVSAWIVDASLSMGRERAWSQTLQHAAALAELMGRDEKAAVVWTVLSGEAEPDSFLTASDLVRLIRNREPGWGRGRTLDALNRAATRLAGAPRPDPELFLIGDLQASGFTTERDTSSIRRWKGTLFVLPCLGDDSNAGVKRAGIEQSLLNADQPPRIFADVFVFGGGSSSDHMVRFFLKDMAVAQQSVSIKPGGTRTESVPVMEDASGWLWGRVQNRQDAFPQDDERWFCAFLPQSIRILIVGATPSDPAYFKFALRPKDENPSRFDVRTGTFDQEWLPLLDKTDAAFLVNPIRPSGRDVQALRRFVENGGGLFICPGKDTDLRQWSDSFFRPVWGDTLTPGIARDGIKLEGVPSGSENQDSGFLTLGRMDTEHPLFSGVFEKGRGPIHSPMIFRTASLTGRAHRVILPFSDGSAFLSSLSLGGGTVLFMGTGIQPEWSDLAFSPIFPPLAVRCAAILAEGGFGFTDEGLAGDSLSMTLASSSGFVRFQAEFPSGERVTLLPRMRSGRMLLTLPRADIPGIYRFFENDEQIGIFAVNPDPRESDFRPITKETLSQICPAATVVFLNPAESLEKQIRSSRTGRELWREMLALALLLLIAETLVGALWK